VITIPVGLDEHPASTSTRPRRAPGFDRHTGSHRYHPRSDRFHHDLFGV